MIGAPLGLAILCILAWGPSFGATGEPGPEVIRVLIPRDMATGSLSIAWRISGKGLLDFEGIQAQEGVTEYQIPFPSQSTVRVVAYVPGFQTAHIDDCGASRTWEPEFNRLPAMQINGKLTDASGDPLAGETIILKYTRTEVSRFFREATGTGPEVLVATAKTQADGTFQAAIPLLHEDPFLHEQFIPTTNPELDITLASMKPEPLSPWVLEPDTLPTQGAHEKGIIIQRLRKARLHGRITGANLKRRGIGAKIEDASDAERAGHLYPLDLEAVPSDGEEKRRWNCHLTEDRSFSFLLPPGEYDLHLPLALPREIWLKKGVVLKEGDCVFLNFE